MTSSYLSYRKELDALSSYTPGTSIEAIQKQYGLSSVIKCASNENPLGCPLSEKELGHVFSRVHYYPDSAHHPIMTYLSEKHHCQQDNLILGNGSDEIFSLLAQAFINTGDEVLSSEHTFSVYKTVTQLMGGIFKEVPMKQWHYDLEGILHTLSDKTKLIFIANPNNPTGTLLSHEDLDRFLKRVPSSVIVVLDEAYREYVTSETCNANEVLLKQHSNLIITRTFSKCYGMAGLRLGYGLCAAELCTILKAVKPPFNVNSLALAAGHYVLEHCDDFIAQSRAMTKDALAFFQEQSKNWPVTLLNTESNFICMLMDGFLGKDAYEFCSKRGIIIRPLSSFGLDHGIRITLCDPESNIKIAEILTLFFKNEGDS
ncbi:histidinol-phosphate transaminase [Candidatus Marinamargulisbacteria bacterium SCGC AG-343-D04]|nr:histidinol-phosphate transaminase [Candidatus Marinamargulisbacteria bacterium SCGC AG-343-D04]